MATLLPRGTCLSAEGLVTSPGALRGSLGGCSARRALPASSTALAALVVQPGRRRQGFSHAEHGSVMGQLSLVLYCLCLASAGSQPWVAHAHHMPPLTSQRHSLSMCTKAVVLQTAKLTGICQ